MIDFKAFYYIFKIAEKKNFTKAAAELYISQPSLSQFVSSLESELDIKLFDRSKTPLELTPAGEIYIEYGKKIIDTYNDLTSKLVELNNSEKGSIKIAASNFRCSCIMPSIISKFNKSFPDISLILFEQNKINGESLIENEDVDFAIVTTPLKNSNLFNSFLICEEEIVLAVPPDYSFNVKYKDMNFNISNLPKVDLKNFKDDNFILLTKNQKMYKLAIELCKKAGFIPKVILQTPLLTTSYSLMKAGIGIAFIPSTLLDQAETYKYIYSIDHFSPKRQVLLIYKKSLNPSYVQKMFIEFLEESYIKI